jgi:hypothetical protein
MGRFHLTVWFKSRSVTTDTESVPILVTSEGTVVQSTMNRVT